MQVSFHKCVYLLCAQFSSSHLLCNRKMARGIEAERKGDRENDNGYCWSIHIFFNDGDGYCCSLIALCVPVIIYLLLIFLVPVTTTTTTTLDTCWLSRIPILHSPLHILIDCCFVSAYQRSDSVRRPKQHSNRNCGRSCYCNCHCHFYCNNRRSSSRSSIRCAIARKLSTVLHTIDFLHFISFASRLNVRYTNTNTTKSFFLLSSWLLALNCCHLWT